MTVDVDPTDPLALRVAARSGSKSMGRLWQPGAQQPGPRLVLGEGTAERADRRSGPRGRGPGRPGAHRRAGAERDPRRAGRPGDGRGAGPGRGAGHARSGRGAGRCRAGPAAAAPGRVGGEDHVGQGAQRRDRGRPAVLRVPGLLQPPQPGPDQRHAAAPPGDPGPADHGQRPCRQHRAGRHPVPHLTRPAASGRRRGCPAPDHQQSGVPARVRVLGPADACGAAARLLRPSPDRTGRGQGGARVRPRRLARHAVRRLVRRPTSTTCGSTCSAAGCSAWSASWVRPSCSAAP